MSAASKAITKAVKTLRDAATDLERINEEIYQKRLDLEVGSKQRIKLNASEDRIDCAVGVLESIANLLDDE